MIKKYLFTLTLLATLTALEVRASEPNYSNVLRKSDFLVVNAKNYPRPYFEQALKVLKELDSNVESLEMLKIKNVRPNPDSIREFVSKYIEDKRRFDYIIQPLIRFDQSKKALTYLGITVYKRNFEKVFHKQIKKNFNEDSLNKFSEEFYLEFREIFYEEGEIVEVDKKQNFIVTVNSNRPADFYVGNKFNVLCGDNQCANLNVEGVFTSSVDEKLIGHIYKGKEHLNYIEKSTTDFFIVVDPKYQKSMDLIKAEMDQTTRHIEFKYPYNFSFLSCAILPITGNYKGSEQIRSEFAKQMEMDGRCSLKESDKFIDIFDRYKDNIDTYLKNKEVLKLFATTLKAGSIFRISVKELMMGTRVSMDVVADNATDILFRERIVFEKADSSTIVDILYQWMVKYIRGLPFHSVVKEAVEGEVFFELGRNAVKSNNQAFVVYRPKRMTINRMAQGHTVVWDQTELAKGIVAKTGEHHSIGQVVDGNVYGEKNLIRKGDWIKLEGVSALDKVKPVFALHNLRKNRQKARFKFGGNFQSINTKIKEESSSASITSLATGVEVFLPLSLLLELDFEKNETGKSGSLADNTYNIGIGYSWILEGNFLVSTFDAYVGYMNYFLPLSILDSPFVGDIKTSGLYSRLKGEMPLYDKLNLHAGITLAPVMEGEARETILGDLTKSSYFSTNANIDYKFDDTKSLFLEYVYEVFDYQQEVNDVETSIKTNKFKVGM
ncbi:MAG: hypothetical protein KC478_14520, partial [Bacteriovoracaceae bacterium]|nr:hypothetical protein [Bacteriovoracaceae bacterium]